MFGSLRIALRINDMRHSLKSRLALRVLAGRQAWMLGRVHCPIDILVLGTNERLDRESAGMHTPMQAPQSKVRRCIVHPAMSFFFFPFFLGGADVESLESW